jgi:hypothetical protein
VTPVIPSRRHPYLYNDGGNDYYATYPPLYANPGTCIAHPRLYRSTQDKVWPKHVAPADGEAKRSTPIASLRYQGNCSHRIRRKTAAPEATFFSFAFPTSSFYYKCNPNPALKTIKGEAGTLSEEDEFTTSDRNTHLAKTITHTHTHTHLTKTTTHNAHLPEETWDRFPLSKACNPYYEHA